MRLMKLMKATIHTRVRRMEAAGLPLRSMKSPRM
jgi:hypothetical protein